MTKKINNFSTDDDKNKVTAHGRVILGQLAEFHADAFKDGEKQDLFHFMLNLEEGKYMKPDFTYSHKNIAEVGVSFDLFFRFFVFLEEIIEKTFFEYVFN